MGVDLRDIEILKTKFLERIGGMLQGSIKVNKNNTYDLGEPTMRFRHIYAQEVTADKINGAGTGGGNATSADTALFLKGSQSDDDEKNLTWFASAKLLPNTIPVLDHEGYLPGRAVSGGLLQDGSRPLTGEWWIQAPINVVPGVTIDHLRVGQHDHTGGQYGVQLDHQNLIEQSRLSTDAHPQYPIRSVDETITGAWMFTNTLDRSVGWKFDPQAHKFLAIPYNMTFLAEEDKSQFILGETGEITANVSEGDISLIVGNGNYGNDVVKMSGSDPDYRFWVGLSDPSIDYLDENDNPQTKVAPFRIRKDGYFESVLGNIAGWEIDQQVIYTDNGRLVLKSGGSLVMGDDARTSDRNNPVLDHVELSSSDNTWRFWAGNTDPDHALFRVNRWGQVWMGGATVDGTIQSQGFQSGYKGWRLDSSGNAEFNSMNARGRIETVVFSERKISAMSGTFIIADAATLRDDVKASDDFIIVDSDIFLRNDVLIIKAVSSDYDTVEKKWKTETKREYMKIVSDAISLSGPDEDEKNLRYKYLVMRNLEGVEGKRQDFDAGETLVRQGSSVQDNPVVPLASGSASGAFGNQQLAGSGAQVQGGWLVLEGSRGGGPYFGVARRKGSMYNQFEEVVRIGNLNGVLERYTETTYGAFVGDASRYWTYDVDRGLEIKTRSGATQINEQGLVAEDLWLSYLDVEPTEDKNEPYQMEELNGYVDGWARFFFTANAAAGEAPLRVGLKMKKDSTTVLIDRIGNMSVDEWTVVSQDPADSVNKTVLKPASYAHHVPWAGVDSKPATFTPSAHRHDYSELDNVPNTDFSEAFRRSWFGI